MLLTNIELARYEYVAELVPSDTADNRDAVSNPFVMLVKAVPLFSVTFWIRRRKPS